jgi:hypothetical protein
MGQMNAGLPQAVVANGNLPIGASLPFLDAGVSVNLADGSEWLRTGFAVSYTPKYAAAGKLDHLKVFGGDRITFSQASSAYQTSQHAHNNAGIICMPYGNSASIMRSANGGATWATQACSVTYANNAIVWAGNRFIAAGRDGTHLNFFHSADGITWTAGSTHTITGTTGTPRFAYNPASSTVLCVFGTAVASAGVMRCAVGSGSTFTAITAAAMTSGLGYPTVAYGAGQAIVLSGDGSGNFYSADDGATWTALSPSPGASANAMRDIKYINGTWIVAGSTASVIYYSTHAKSLTDNWTSLAITETTATLMYPDSFAHFTVSADGKRLYWGTGNGFFVTTNGTSWRRMWSSIPTNGTGAKWFVFDSGIGLALSESQSSSGHRALFNASNTLPSYVGMLFSSGYDASVSVKNYVRIA